MGTLVFWAAVGGVWWIWLNRVPDETTALLATQTPVTAPVTNATNATNATNKTSTPNAFYTILRGIADKLSTADTGVSSGDLIKETAWHEKNKETLASLRMALGQEVQSSIKNENEKDLTAFQSLAELFCRESDYFAMRGEQKLAMNAALDAISLGVKISHGSMACEKIGRDKLELLVPRLLSEEAKEAAKRLEEIEGERTPVNVALTDPTDIPSRINNNNHDNNDPRKENDMRMLRLFTEKNVFQLPLILRDKATPNWQVYLAEARMAFTPKRRIWGNYLHYRNGKTPTPPTDPISPFFLSNDKKTAIAKTAVGQTIERTATVQEKTQQAEAENEARTRLTRLHCLLRAYQLERGENPAQVAALTEEGYTNSHLLDPFGKGQPLQIDSDTGKAFSVGPDGMPHTPDDIF